MGGLSGRVVKSLMMGSRAEGGEIFPHIRLLDVNQNESLIWA